MSLVICMELLDVIREHGRSDYPAECCGLLIGRASGRIRNVFELKPVENARFESRHNRYLIEPDAFMAAEDEARKRGLEILGIYHSHPDHPSRPSEFDREYALPWYSYLIVNISQGKPGNLASWNLRPDRSGFDPEDIVCETSAAASF